MGDDWSVVLEGTNPLPVTRPDGSRYTLTAEKPEFSTRSACEMLDFIQGAMQAAGFNRLTAKERTDGWFDSLINACQNDRGAGPTSEIIVTPNPGTSTTPPPAPPPADGDSAQGQGAPAVAPGILLNRAGTDANGT